MATDTTTTMATDESGDERDAGTPADSAADPPPGDGEVVYTTAPLLKPVLALVGATVVVALLVVGPLVAAPGLVGGTSIAELLLNATVVLVAVVLLRLGATLLVLWRTTYTLRTDGFEKTYELAYRRNERQIPITQLRGQECTRSRFQSLIDCATVSLLTGGTNRSLGFVEFEHIPASDRVQRHIRELRRQYEHRQGEDG